MFRQLNTQALSKRDAINFGAFNVGHTSAATFKVMPAGRPATGSFKKKGFMGDFYKKGNLFIEKRGRRIKSSGELREITYKGIQALKMGKLKIGGKK